MTITITSLLTIKDQYYLGKNIIKSSNSNFTISSRRQGSTSNKISIKISSIKLVKHPGRTISSKRLITLKTLRIELTTLKGFSHGQGVKLQKMVTINWKKVHKIIHNSDFLLIWWIYRIENLIIFVDLTIISFFKLELKC